MRNRKAQLLLTVFCFALGLLLVIQYRTQQAARTRLEGISAADKAVIISNLVAANAQLREEISSLETQIQSLAASGRTPLEELVDELNRMKIINGLVEVSGPGVEVRIEGEVNALDLQDLINELRNAGAEAIAINEQRVAVSSMVTSDSSGGLSINGVPIEPPFVLQAIGSPQTMQTALLRAGGLIAVFEHSYPDLSITVQQRGKLVLPIYARPLSFRYATAIEQRISQ
ncbi:MAG: DUF881 domain-containing protein [Anaerolineae bacterium]|jgi:uncharacterized protein YlxW (UPF0749 family)|nr:DUF881 domain-containing protein [Anaerolineae bacterium]MDH7475723.1 DUF881 domain-containing protein [Anaerolineae bacterium]